MRACTAIAVFAISFASIAAASAADMRVGGGATYGGFYAGGERAGQVVIFDSEPGVVVRPYWIPPWRQRYFPATGKKPHVGRRENLAERGVYKPAESYHRYWSTVSYGADPWRGPVPQYAVAPPPARREVRRELQLK